MSVSFLVCVLMSLSSGAIDWSVHRIMTFPGHRHFLINTVLQFGNTLILSRQPIGMVLMCTIICAIF